MNGQCDLPAGTDLATLEKCLTVMMPAALPGAEQIMEACARGMARCSVSGSLVTFDYTPAGLRSDKWRAVVSRLRGLVVDATCQDDPVRVWPTPMVTDLHPHTVVPANRTPEVQEKVDGVLVARFFHEGSWRWASRDGLLPDVEAIAARHWSHTGVVDDVVGRDTVLYFEVVDPMLQTPSGGGCPGLYLLDVMDRRDGRALGVPEVRKMAQDAGWRTPAVRDWPGSLQPFVEELRTAGPAVEGWVFRWDHHIRGRLVNEKYTLLSNLLSTRSAGAVVDLWLSAWGIPAAMECIPADLRAEVLDLCAQLDALACDGSPRHRERAAYVVLAAGGPERTLGGADS